MTGAIATRALMKAFPDFTLGPLDLAIPTGLVTGLIGANGAGKTTLLRLLLGALLPSVGSADVVDRDRTGVVSADLPYPKTWDAATISRYVGPLYSAWDEDHYRALLTAAGINRAQQVGTLSRGVGLQLQMAVALSHDADTLLLDEPTAGLDPVARAELLDRLRDFMAVDGHTVVIASHITSDIEQLADHVVMLRDGQLLLEGAVDEVVDSYRLVRGPRALADEVRPIALGLREHSVGWEALLPTEETAALLRRPDLTVQAPGLEQLFVHLMKGADDDRHAA